MKHSFQAIALTLTLAGGWLFASAPVALAAEVAEKTVIPATTEGVWQAIDGKSAELKRTIDSGALKEVHHQAFAIRDLVRALPTHSPSLTPEALTEIRRESKFVDTLAERLDQTGDANDKPGTEANLQKLEGVLKLLRAQYPGPK